MEDRSTFIGLIRPTRAGFVERMLPEEEAAMEAHAAYLRQLLSDKTLLLAGPYLDRVFGLSIFEAESKEASFPGSSPFWVLTSSESASYLAKDLPVMLYFC